MLPGKIDFNNDSAIIQGGAVLINAEKVLLRITQPDRWEFPKGHLETGESPVLAAQRELFEETGYIGNLLYFVDVVEYSRKGKKYRLYLYAFSIKEETSSVQWHLENDSVWETIDEAVRKLSFDEYKKIIQKIQRREFNKKERKDIFKQNILLYKDLLGVSNKIQCLSKSNFKCPAYFDPQTRKKIRIFQTIKKAKDCETILSFISNLPISKLILRHKNLLVTDWINGVPISESEYLLKKNLPKAGQLLARLHSIPIEALPSSVSALQVKQEIIKKFDSSISTLFDAGIIEEKRMHNIKMMFNKNFPEKEKLVIVHWDFVPFNILIDGSQLKLIDFENIRISFAGVDLSKALHFFCNSDQEEKKFLSGYSNVSQIKSFLMHRSFFDAFRLIKSAANRIQNKTPITNDIVNDINTI